MSLQENPTPSSPMTISADIDMDDAAFETGASLVRWTDREVQVISLCKTMWPLALDYRVHKRIMGSYNETIPATIILSDAEQPLEVIVRLPSQWGAFEISVMDQVAVLHYVQTSTPIRVPKVIAYDTTPNNALESQFMIMERLRGRDLDEVIDDMTAEQRKDLALELSVIYHQLRHIKSPYSGRIVASDACHMPSLRPEETLSQIPIAVEPYAARVLYRDGDWRAELPTQGKFRDIPEEFITSGGLLSDPPNLPLLEMTTRPFNRRLVQQETFFPEHENCLELRIQLLRDMMDFIVDEEHVENPANDFQLVHVDLFPRNIMVDPSSRPMITGIIDWDEAVFAPGFVANASPAWLWELRPADDDDADQGTEEEEEEAGMPFQDPDKESFERSTEPAPTPELQEVKRVWEEAAGPECVESATNPYAILARRFLRIVTFWQWPYWMQGLYEETLEEFNKLGDEDEAEYLAKQAGEEHGKYGLKETGDDDDGDSGSETVDEEDEHEG